MKLPKAETLILLAFLVCTAVWAVSKCSNRRAEQVRQVREIDGDDAEDRPKDTVRTPLAGATHTPTHPPTPTPSLTPTTPQIPITHNTTQPATPQPGQAARPTPTQSTLTPTQSTPKQSTPTPKQSTPTPKPAPTPTTPSTTLYVTMDGLKVRKEPGLKGETIAELKLYEPVTFLNKKTDWTQEISLGTEKATDHWVKVRTKSGKEGWVFGAGVHYYKIKRN